MALMVVRNSEVILLPADDFELRIEDEILFCGRSRVLAQMLWTVYNYNVLRYVMSGAEAENGYLWQRFFRKQSKAPQKAP